jgi:hypothetical protein
VCIGKIECQCHQSASVLALATLGNEAQITSIPISSKATGIRGFSYWPNHFVETWLYKQEEDPTSVTLPKVAVVSATVAVTGVFAQKLQM